MSNKQLGGDTTSIEITPMNVDTFMEQNHREISSGLPFKTALEFQNFLLDFFVFGDTSGNRLPILGMADGKIFLQSNLINGGYQHRLMGSLLAKENPDYGDMGDVHNPAIAFSTSFEAVTPVVPEVPYMKVTTDAEVTYVKMGAGSTYYDAKFNEQGKAKMKAIIEAIPGVEFFG